MFYTYAFNMCIHVIHILIVYMFLYIKYRKSENVCNVYMQLRKNI